LKDVRESHQLEDEILKLINILLQNGKIS